MFHCIQLVLCCVFILCGHVYGKWDVSACINVVWIMRRSDNKSCLFSCWSVYLSKTILHEVLGRLVVGNN